MSGQLEFLQNLTERQFTELVLCPLLETMGFEEIRYNNGPSELGKDIIFSRTDKLDGRVYSAAVVKSKRLTGDVSSNRSLRELCYQIQQSVIDDTVDPQSGSLIKITNVYVFNSHEITQTALKSVQDKIGTGGGKISIHDGRSVLRLIQEFDPKLLSSCVNSRSSYLETITSSIIRSTGYSRFGSSKNFSIKNSYIQPRVKVLSDLISSPQSNPSTEKPIDTDDLQFRWKNNYVLVADVGTGKTSFFQTQILGYSGGKKASKKSNFPIFIPLHVFSYGSFQSLESFKLSIENYISGQGFTEFSFSSGTPYTLVFDGFDELQSSHNSVAKYIGILGCEPNLRVAVSSRPNRIPVIAGFEYYSLEPFNDLELGKYLSLWFDFEGKKFLSVLREIRNNYEINALCRTPLFLTLYCIIAFNSSTSALPKQKLSVYEEISKLLLGGWDAGRNIKNNFDSDIKKRVLSDLAFKIHKSNRRDLSEQEFRISCRKVLAAIRNVPEKEIGNSMADELICEIIFRSGLIREAETQKVSRRFEFVHLSFQEYFCALEIFGFDRIDWQTLLTQAWWRNVSLLLVQMKQSLDGIPIPPQKVLKKSGLLFHEYVNYAPFSTLEVKLEWMNVSSTALLRLGDLNKHISNIEPRNQKLFIEALRTSLSSFEYGKPYDIYFNYLLRINNDDGYRQFCWDIELLNFTHFSPLAYIIRFLESKTMSSKNLTHLIKALKTKAAIEIFDHYSLSSSRAFELEKFFEQADRLAGYSQQNHELRNALKELRVKVLSEKKRVIIRHQ